MKQLLVAVVCIVCLLGVSCLAASAEETESAAKAAMRKILEEKRKAESLGISTEENKGLIEINRATKPQLMTLPGIGEAEADKIIAGRPYQAKTQLRERGILSADVFYGIVSKIDIVYVPPAPVVQQQAPAAEQTNNDEEAAKKRKMWKDLLSK